MFIMFLTWGKQPKQAVAKNNHCFLGFGMAVGGSLEYLITVKCTQNYMYYMKKSFSNEFQRRINGDKSGTSFLYQFECPTFSME